MATVSTCPAWVTRTSAVTCPHTPACTRSGLYGGIGLSRCQLTETTGGHVKSPARSVQVGGGMTISTLRCAQAAKKQAAVATDWYVRAGSLCILVFGPFPPNESRVSCGALTKDSFPNVRAPPASRAG